MKLDCLRVSRVIGPASIAEWPAYTCLLSSPTTAHAQILLVQGCERVSSDCRVMHWFPQGGGV